MNDGKCYAGNSYGDLGESKDGCTKCVGSDFTCGTENTNSVYDLNPPAVEEKPKPEPKTTAPKSEEPKEEDPMQKVLKKGQKQETPCTLFSEPGQKGENKPLPVGEWTCW